MKYRLWQMLGIALVNLSSGYSPAQDSAKARWNEARARETALAISSKWKFSPDDFQTGDASDLHRKVSAENPGCFLCSLPLAAQVRTT
jgi:hypothetical protein